MANTFSYGGAMTEGVSLDILLGLSAITLLAVDQIGRLTLSHQ